MLLFAESFSVAILHLLHTSWLLKLRESPGQAQSLENFGRNLFHREWFVTSAAILSNHLPILTRVRAVVTAEAAWKIRVTYVVRIGAPRNL